MAPNCLYLMNQSKTIAQGIKSVVSSGITTVNCHTRCVLQQEFILVIDPLKKFSQEVTITSRDSTYMYEYFTVQICSCLLSSRKTALGFSTRLVNLQKHTWIWAKEDTSLKESIKFFCKIGIH